jgi:hypothetical protein
VNRAAVLLVRGVLIAGVLTLAGCGTPPRAQTTFLTNVDLVDMTDRMAESFARTPAIAVRTPRDAPWIISIARVANNTNQIITDNERWAYVGRLRAVLTQSVVSDRRSLVWIVPPERWPLIASELSLIGEPPDLRRPPTHLMTALRRADRNGSRWTQRCVCLQLPTRRSRDRFARLGRCVGGRPHGAGSDV